MLKIENYNNLTKKNLKKAMPLSSKNSTNQFILDLTNFIYYSLFLVEDYYFYY